MEGNISCSICTIEPAVQMCICSNLPRFCANCRVTHETKSGFHFPLPLEALNYVNTQNQHQYRIWLISLTNSQEKLRENIPRMDQCRRKIEELYREIREELIPDKTKVLESLEELRAGLSTKSEEAIKECCSNAYKGDYQPSSYLASLIWTHSYQQSSDPITVFTYTVQTDTETMKHFMGISFQTTVPEIAHLNYYGGKSDIWKEIRELKIRVEEGRQREETLIAQGIEREKLLITQCEQRELTLKTQAKAREDMLIEAIQRTESRETQLAKEIEALKANYTSAIQQEVRLTYPQLQNQLTTLDQFTKELKLQINIHDKQEKDAATCSQQLQLQVNELETRYKQLETQKEAYLQQAESTNNRLNEEMEALNSQKAGKDELIRLESLLTTYNEGLSAQLTRLNSLEKQAEERFQYHKSQLLLLKEEAGYCTKEMTQARERRWYEADVHVRWCSVCNSRCT